MTRTWPAVRITVRHTPVLLALMAVGCSRGTRTQPPSPPSTHLAPTLPPTQVVQRAELSPDGTVLAVTCYTRASGGVSARAQVHLLDTTTGEEVAASPPDQDCFLIWGPRNSYILRPAPASDAPAYLWARSAGEPAQPLTSPEARAAAADVRGVCVDPGMQSVLVVTGTASDREGGTRSGSEVHRIALTEGTADGLVARLSEVVGLFTIVPMPRAASVHLAVLVARSRDEAGLRRELLAMDTASGRIVWRTALPGSPGPIYAALPSLSPGEGTFVLARATEIAHPPDPPVPGHADYYPGRAELWEVRARDGDLRFLCEVPEEVVRSPVHGGADGTTLFVPTRLGMWEVAGTGSKRSVKQLIQSTPGSVPAGAHVTSDGDIVAYFMSTTGIWRCRVRSGQVEAFWGSPGPAADTPRVLRPTPDRE